MKPIIDSASGQLNESLFLKLASDLEYLLSRFGTLSNKGGDYWVAGVKLPLLAVEVIVFAKVNFTADLLAACSTLLDSYPEEFRIRFIEGGGDGMPLEPLGGLELNRYGYDVIGK